MKKLINICIFFLAVSSFMSCSEDFLEQPPRGTLTAGNFPSSASDAELALNGAYNSLRSWQLASGGFPLLDILSDEATKGSNPGDGTAIKPYDEFTHNAIEGSLERYYKTLYQAVRRTNLVISKVPEITMDQNRKDQIIAEARFLRAYFYGLLVRSFGAVPMVTDVDPTLDLGRTAALTILDEIIKPDMENAIALLPERSEQELNNLGRATKGSARGEYARILLYFQDYITAEKLLQDIVESQEYKLQSNYNEIFSDAFEHNQESVFEVTALPLSFDQGGNQFANTMSVRGTPNRGWGFGRPAFSWIKKMDDENDPRLQASVIFLNEELDGVVNSGDSSTPDTTYVNGQIVEIECYNQKVWHSGTDTESTFGHNRRIIRYSDVLLMLAETLNENNKSADALLYLNEVRRRAAGGNMNILPDITTTSKSELFEIIIEERHRELALEGLRFWDLVRTNKAKEVLGPLGFTENKNELLPIPQSEIDISEGRITQNQGY